MATMGELGDALSGLASSIATLNLLLHRPASAQEAIDRTQTGGSVDLTGLPFSGGCVISRAMTVTGLDVTGQATGEPAFDDADNGIYVTAAGVHLISPRARGFGGTGLLIEDVDGFAIDDPDISHCQYAGIMGISAANGTVLRPRITDIGMSGGSGSPNWNAYGIAWTDTGGPVSHHIDVLGEGVGYIDGVLYWHGYDTHSGHDLNFFGVRLARTPRPVFIVQNRADSPRPHTVALDALRIEAAGSLPAHATNPVAVTVAWADGVHMTNSAVASAFGNPVLYNLSGTSTDCSDTGTTRF